MVRRIASVATGILPGAVAGAQIAGLLFFLNPHWPTDLGPWLRTVLVYATLLGLMGFLVQLPFVLRQPRRALRALPWALVIVFLACGALHWWHASHLGLYLPPGINRRLIKAGALLLAAGLVGFYVALLHTAQQRRYGLRARVAMICLSLTAVYVVVERREAYHAPAAPTPRPALVTAEEGSSSQTLFVGISTLTLDVILPLAEQGRLPFFAQFVREGAVGRLESLDPTRTERLWWTMMTGVLPYRLAEAGAVRYAATFVGSNEVFREIPAGLGFERWGVSGGALPMSRSEPPFPPLWEVSERVGLPAQQVGFAVGEVSSEGALVEAAAAVTSMDLTDDEREAFSTDPLLQSAAQRDLAVLRTALSHLSSPAGSAETVRALFVRLDGLALVSADTYGAFSRVELEGRRRQDLESSARRLERYYLFLDRLLQELWSSALPGTEREASQPARTMIVASPFGIRERSSNWAPWFSIWPRLEHQGTTSGGPDGAWLLRGPGIRVRSFRASLTDVAATVAYSLGLPVARDLDGGVRAELFEPAFLAEHPLRFVPSYGTVARPAGVRTSVGLLPERPTSPEP